MNAYRDIVCGHIFGFGRLLIPIVGYVLIYPVFISTYGVEIFAVWTLIFSISSAISLSDLGLSEGFTRRISRAQSSSVRIVIKSEFELVRRVTIIAGCVVSFCLVAIQAVLAPFAAVAYSEAGVFLCCLAVAAGALLSIQSRLNEAPFRAFHQNGFLQILQTFKQVGSFASLAIGILLDRPFEVFGIGYLFSEAMYLWLLVLCERRKVADWQALPQRTVRVGRRRIALAVVNRSAGLLMLSLALILRDPLLRLIVAGQFGLAAAGAYELIYRIAISGFNACAAGVSTFLPNLSRTVASPARARSLMQALSLLMAGLSAGCMGGAMLMIRPLLHYWTGPASTALAELAVCFIIWLWVNLLFLPVWYYVVSRHQERQLAIIVVLHMALSMVLLLTPIDFSAFLACWCAAGTLIYAGYFLTRLASLGRGVCGRALAGYGLTYSAFSISLCVALSMSGLLISVPGAVAAATAHGIIALWMVVRALRSFRSLYSEGVAT